MTGGVNLKEFVAGFVLEAQEHLHSVGRNLVATSEALKHQKPEPRAVRELFRSLHTIKGLASMVGAEPIVELSHEMEGILRTADRAGGRLSEQALDLLVQGTRAIEERVQRVSKAGTAEMSPAPSKLLEALALAQNPQASSAPIAQAEIVLPDEIQRGLTAADREQVVQALEANRRAVLIEFEPSAEKAQRGLNITSVRDKLSKLGELIKVVPRSTAKAPTGISFILLMVTDADNSGLGQACGSPESSIQEISLNRASSISSPSEGVDAISPVSETWESTDSTSIRVDIRRLDDVLERLSELVVTRSKLSRVAAKLRAQGADVREFDAVIAENSRQLKRLRAAITQARMVPLADLLQRLPLIVRGLTKDSNRSVDVGLKAGTAEVDKAVADQLFPAVVHLIRNSVDHAIEPREERVRLGKPESGTISVKCDDSSGINLILTIHDDGRGIDRHAVAKKANQPVAQNDEELLEQITMPGLSTSEDVTHTSGRGMGMDIVRKTIESLRGSLSLSSRPGEGTTFTLRVPVSITIVDALSFESAGQVYVVPVAMIDEIVDVEPARVVKSPAPKSDRGFEPHLIERRGEAIPLIALDTILQKRGRRDVPPKALVVSQLRGAIAFGVDRMLGQQEVVIRPLDDELLRVTGLSGATDLGDGNPTLVLDLASLGASLVREFGVNK